MTPVKVDSVVVLTEESQSPTVVLPESALQSNDEGIKADISIDPKEERVLVPLDLSLSEESDSFGYNRN